MEIVFLGVGEAFDDALPNTSILIRCGEEKTRATLLLDCGYTTPPQFWKEENSAEALDAVWISHFHADHFFGLPALLIRFWEDGRKKPLTILGQKGIETLTRKCVDLAYPGFYERIRFPIKFQEVESEKSVPFLGLTFQAAQNEHSLKDLALRINAGERSLFYSGDGQPTAETIALAKGSELIIHEAFLTDTAVHGHATVEAALDMAKASRASTLALVHIQRRERKQVLARIQELRDQAGPVNLIIPEPGDRIVI
jgi:ribonuclease Z